MLTLEIEFHGLCLLVPDTAGGAMHVLAPALQDPDSEPHAVRLLHRSFAEPGGRSLEGWALEMGTQPGPIDTTLQAANAAQGEIVDLTALTGGTVPRRLLADGPVPELVARITLRSGHAISVTGQGSRWMLDGQEIVLAQTLTWRTENVDELKWISLGASGETPLPSLRELPPDEGGVIRLRIIHAPENAPSRDDMAAAEEAVHRYFLTFYHLLETGTIRAEPLPRLAGPPKGAGLPFLAMAVLPGTDDTDDWGQRRPR